MTRLFFTAIALMATLNTNAQQDTIIFQLNGRPSNKEVLVDTPEKALNPFAPFVGEWTLQDDNWTQNWGGDTETIKIEGHHTVCSVLNTDHSLLSIIDGPEPNGHIFWTYNPVTKEVLHTSSFGASRIGKGTGRLNEKGDLSLRVTFEGEAAGTYRQYTYKWLSKDSYEMISIQMGENDQPTGLFYSGTFVRLQTEAANRKEDIRQEVLEHGRQIREAFSENNLSKIRQLHHPEVTKALGYDNMQKDREAVMEGLRGTLQAFQLDFVENEVESILIQGDVAIEQTRFVIKGTPRAEGAPFIFQGRTMVTYVRHAASPSGWATIREIIQPKE